MCHGCEHKVRAHRAESIHGVESNITNAISENINSKIQRAKYRARRFGNNNAPIDMIHFLCARLAFSCPWHSTTHHQETIMISRLTALLLGIFIFSACSTVATAQSKTRKIYLLTHGSDADPMWIEWNRGAIAACAKIHAKCHISFHSNNVSSQKEAFNSAIAARADGIATTSAEPKIWNKEVAAATKAGIPVVFFNSDDPAAGRYSYIGADLFQAGVIWAKYLVDNKVVKAGDKVFLPVEAAGATYQVLETKGVASVFDPLGIKYNVLEVGSEPASLITRMTEYLTANRDVKAIIGLGDLVTAHSRAALKNIGAKPGQIPVVGWGYSKDTAEAVMEGYAMAGLWQFPYDLGYLPVMIVEGLAKAGGKGYDITTLDLYDKSNVQTFLKTMMAAQKK